MKLYELELDQESNARFTRVSQEASLLLISSLAVIAALANNPRIRLRPGH